MREIRVKVTPGTRKESVVEAKDGRFLVCVNAPREEGKANDRMRELVAAHLAVPLAHVTIVRGHTQPTKTVRVSSH